jgi:hypothetical protein
MGTLAKSVGCGVLAFSIGFGELHHLQAATADLDSVVSFVSRPVIDCTAHSTHNEAPPQVNHGY